MPLKLLEDNDNQFKVERDDGEVIPIAKTPETMPIYKLVKQGALTQDEDSTPTDTDALQGSLNKTFNLSGQPPQAQAATPPPTDTPSSPTPAVEPGANPPVAPQQPQTANAMPMVSQSQTQTTAERATPEAQKAIDDFGNSVKDYQKNTLDALTQQQQLNVAKSTAETNLINENNQKYQAFVQERDQEIQRRLGEIKTVEDRFKGMSIDGGRFFGDGLTGSKVLAGIGLALGALGQGFSGKDYGVMGIIERAIDRDIEVQKANVNKVGKEVELARGGLRDYMAVSHDMDTAIASEKARQLEAVGKQFEAIAAANSSAAVKAAAQQAAMPFMEKAANLKLEAGKNVTTHVVNTMPMKLDAVPEKVNEDVNKNIEAIHSLDQIEALKKKIGGTGPIEGRIKRYANSLGIVDDEDLAKFEQRLKDNLIQYAHKMGGARGASPQEMAMFEQATLSDLMDDKRFDALLKQRRSDLEGELNVMQRQVRENRQYPIDIEGRKKAFAGGDNPADSLPDYYKPQGLKKRK